MASQLNDLIVSKLAQRYTTTPVTFADLWTAYCAEYNSGVYWVGDSLYNHYGGTEVELQDRAFRFWTAWVPATGG